MWRLWIGQGVLLTLVVVRESGVRFTAAATGDGIGMCPNS